MKRNKKILVSIILVLIGSLAIGCKTKPTPDNKRNISETDAKIEVEVSDPGETRAPIIRTYKQDDYNSFNEKEIKELMSTIRGNIEGDIPAVNVKDDKNIVYITFLKNGKVIDLDGIPDIEIEVSEGSADTVENKIVINDKLIKADGNYNYRIERYKTQYEKYFFEYNIIRIFYEIDGDKYVSVFGLNTSNTDDGTNYFENEDLENPIEPEV